MKVTSADLGLKTARKGKEDLAPDSPIDEVAQFWKQQIADARKREKDFRKAARKTVDIYEAGKDRNIPFNILYSNTETLLPVLYSQAPRPVVKRRQRNNNDPKALLAARVAQRMLEYFLDSGLGHSPDFDELAQRSCLQALVAGRGLMRFRYEADIQKVKQPDPRDPSTTVEVESLKNEYIAAEYVEWDRILLGYSQVWKQTPWLAFEHAMSRQELVENFGERLGKLIPLTLNTSEEDKSSAEEVRDEVVPADSQGAKLAQVYEIWDRNKKEVVFFAPSYEREILKRLPDPLGLSGFFPCAEPLVFMLKITSMVPKPLYLFYKEQAEELNEITRRIKLIVKALKVRGFYDSSLKGMEILFEQDDNKLLPADNVAAMQQGQTLEKAIWFMPLEKLVVVLQQLYAQRQQVKALIYEITGISDILRGSSAASETLGAQEMKQTWATIRIKRMQRSMMKYLRSNLRIMAELAVTKLSAETIAGMTGVELPTAEDKMKAQEALQLQRMKAQIDPRAQPDPKALQTLQYPTMEEVLELLQNDLLRSYHIDIETNSMLESEATEDKQQVGEFLNAMAQFMSGVTPLLQSKMMPFEAVQAILSNVTRRYRMGDEVEEALTKMQPPVDPKEAEGKGKGKDIEGEKALMQAKVQMQQQELQLKQALGKLQIELEQAKLDLEKQKMQMDLEQTRLLGELKVQQAMTNAAMPKPVPVSGTWQKPEGGVR